MILRATEEAIQTLLQKQLDDVYGGKGAIPILLSDSVETKVEMPYIILQCVSAEEQITPGSGIFKVAGDLVFKSNSRTMSAAKRQTVLDAINNFAYNSTAIKLSTVPNYHCHGWHPTTGEMTVDNETKATIYAMKYWVYCMAMDNT